MIPIKCCCYYYEKLIPIYNASASALPRGKGRRRLLDCQPPSFPSSVGHRGMRGKSFGGTLAEKEIVLRFIYSDGIYLASMSERKPLIPLSKFSQSTEWIEANLLIFINTRNECRPLKRGNDPVDCAKIDRKNVGLTLNVNLKTWGGEVRAVKLWDCPNENFKNNVQLWWILGIK